MVAHWGLVFIQFPKWRSAPGIPVVQGDTTWVFMVVQMREVWSLLFTTSEVIKEPWGRGYPQVLSLGRRAKSRDCFSAVHCSPRWKTPLQRWISPKTLLPRVVEDTSQGSLHCCCSVGAGTHIWPEHRLPAWTLPALAPRAAFPPQGSLRQGIHCRQPVRAWLLPGWLQEPWAPRLALHRGGWSAELSCIWVLPLQPGFENSSALQRLNCRKSAQLCNKRSCHALIHSDSISKKNHLADLDKGWSW